MKENACDQYIEWMSLAQDGLLNNTQTRLLHAHLAECPACQVQWEAMTLVSRMFHAAPMVAPLPGFALRFQARLAHYEEQRRQATVGVLLGAGVIALVILALPSVIGVLCFTGSLVLPYEVVAYVEGLFGWADIVLNALAEAAWVLIRYFATPEVGLACAGSAAMVGTLALVWSRFLSGRFKAQKVR